MAQETTKTTVYEILRALGYDPDVMAKQINGDVVIPHDDSDARCPRCQAACCYCAGLGDD